MLTPLISQVWEDFHSLLSRWPELLQRVHIIFIIRILYDQSKRSQHGSLKSVIWAEVSLQACWTSFKTPQLAAPASLCQPAPCSRLPLLLWVWLWTENPRHKCTGLEELIFSMVWGQKTTDLLKKGVSLLKRTVDPSLKDEEAIFHRKVKRTTVLPADCGPYSLVHLKTDRCTTLG